MERMVFADSWESFFFEAGFRSFDDFFDYHYEVEGLKDKKRAVNILTLGQGAERKEFFMKRFHHSHLKDMFLAWRDFGGLMSQAAVEWKNAKLLLSCGIETYRPACFGERIRWGLEKESFLVTEKLQTQCLTDFVAGNWPRLTQQQKEELIAELAGFVRRIHDAGISLPDLYVWHIFISENSSNGKYEFTVIDLHRMERNVTNSSQQIKNLGRFDYSMRDEYFDDRLRRLFIESYAGDNWPGGSAKLAGKVKKYSKAILARRNQKPY